MADSFPKAAANNGIETTKMDISSLYAPNQPYFPGVIDKGFANQALVAVGVDPMRVLPLSPPFPNPPQHLACPDFFNHFDQEIFERGFDGVYWKYIMRREAQAILPFLWIGPASTARNAEYLKENGITLLLGIRTTHPSHTLIVNGTRAAEKLGIQCEHIAVDGLNELVRLMPNIIRGINEHVCRCPRHAPPTETPKLNKAMVFCETGNEKSLAVVVGYLMAMVGLDLATAAHNVQARRLCANFDESQRYMLASFEALLNAQRDVARAHEAQSLAPESPGSTQQARRKRSFVDAGMEMDNANGDGAAGLGNDEVRQQPPPFCDRNP